MNIIKQNVHKSIAMWDRSNAPDITHQLCFAFGDDAPYMYNWYIFPTITKDAFIKQFHEIIENYSNGIPSELFIWINKSLSEIEWLMELLKESDPLIIDTWLYCCED